MNLPSKLPDVGTTIFTVMSQLANESKAINLSQGFPGFDCDPYLVDLVTRFMKEGKNQYAPMTGIPELREILSEKTKSLYQVDYDSESEVTIVSGATDALFSAVSAVVQPGDEVILLEPAYDSYAPAVKLSGGVAVFVPLNIPEFSVDWDRVKDAITEKTRVIMVNNPHNPSGYVWTKQDLDTLAGLVRDKNIFIISDEVYEHIIFDGRKHLSLMCHPVLKERTFICGSFGKTFHVTGWKIGYCLAPKPLSIEFRKVHQFVTFSTATPLQFALAEYLKDERKYLDLPGFYQKKRDLFCSGLSETDFKFTPSQGSFFQLVSYKHLSSISDYELSVKMCKEVGVACIPISVFFNQKEDHKILRFCFAKSDSELLEALDKLNSSNLF